MKPISTYRNIRKGVVGIKFKNFSVGKKVGQDRYGYTIKNSSIILRSDLPTIYFERRYKINKYYISLIHTTIAFALPIAIIPFALYFYTSCYFDGGYNLIMDRSDYSNVRYYNAVNIILIIILVISHLL